MKLGTDVHYCMKIDEKMDSGHYASYYELPPNCKTLHDLMYSMTVNQHNIFKAAYRWDKKPNLEYNLLKMKFYVDDALRRLYASDPENPRHEGQ